MAKTVRIVPRHKDVYVSHTVIVDGLHYIRSLYINRYESTVRYRAVIWEMYSPKTNTARRLTDKQRIEELETLFQAKNKILKQ